MIRRVLSGALGLASTLVGWTLVYYPFTTEPSFGPPSSNEKILTVAAAPWRGLRLEPPESG